jgi:hypothetical protein
MSLDYIKHDEQFYACIKLLNGEEIIGETIVTMDDESERVYIQNPAKIVTTEIKKENVKGMGYTLVKWYPFSDEILYIIPEDRILTIAPLSSESLFMYKVWLKNENLEESEVKEVPLNKNMGKVSSVNEARMLLEDIFKRL